MDNQQVDVIIVGGGASGLTCALSLLKVGVNVLILEARDRVGGRIYETEYLGLRWDLGGQWIGPGQTNMYNLAKAYNIPVLPQKDDGKKVIEINGKVKSYHHTIPPLNLLGLIELQIAIKRLDKMGKQLPLARPYDAPKAKEWDNITVQQWMDKTFFFETSKKLFHIGFVTVLSMEPSEISLLFLVHYAKCAGGMMKLLEVKNGAQQNRLFSGQLMTAMAADLGGRILLNQPVQSVYQDENGVRVTTLSNVFFAKYIVLAIPPVLSNRINFTPALPMTRQLLTQSSEMGHCIKFIIFYSSNFWIADGYSGQIISDRESVTLTYDATVNDVAAIVGFFEAHPARNWSNRSPEERQAEVVTLLYKCFKNPLALTPVNYIEIDWQREQWSLGGYEGVFPPGVLSQYGQSLAQPVGRIHWAGTETSEKWNGYMEGAFIAGERASQEVILRLQQVQQSTTYSVHQTSPQQIMTQVEQPIQNTFVEKQPQQTTVGYQYQACNLQQ